MFKMIPKLPIAIMPDITEACEPWLVQLRLGQRKLV